MDEKNTWPDTVQERQQQVSQSHHLGAQCLEAVSPHNLLQRSRTMRKDTPNSLRFVDFKMVV